MLATHSVTDADNEIVGYIVDDIFYTDYYLRQNIEFVDNISLDAQGRIRPDQELPCFAYANVVTRKKYQDITAKNPFVRDIQRDLEEWKQEKDHGVLQLEGSRQIGKTTELLKFAYKNYEYVIYVNLASDLYDFKSVIQNGCSPMEFEKYCRRAGEPHFKNSSQTIVIIDEIQVSEQVYNAIRSIASSVKCDIIVTGSYLGQTIKEGYFLPAGTVSYRKMYPEIDHGNIEGILTETFVFAELYRLFTERYCRRKVKGDTPSFSIYGQNELDFMLSDRENNIYGIEVKTNDGTPKSLRVYMDKKLVDRAIVANRTSGGREGCFETIPVFAVGCRFPYQ